MKTVHLVITNTGDGSNGLEWFKNTPIEKIRTLEDTDLERYSSGDGIQITTLYFPDDFDFEAMGIADYQWMDEEAFETYDD